MLPRNANFILSPRLKAAFKKCALTADSFYLYDERDIIEKTESLTRNFPNVEFLYSVKCNPNRNVARRVFAQGFGADAASLNEVLASSALGLAPNAIYYSAPGKTTSDLETAASKSIPVADSLAEIKRLQAIAKNRGTVLEIGVRVNPDFSFDGSPGLPSQFGIDADQLYEFLSENVDETARIVGVHIHLKSQELNADAVAEYYAKTLRFAEEFQSALKRRLSFVNLGSGIGIPYAATDVPLDLARLARLAQKPFAAFRKSNPTAKILVEVGRGAVGKCGYYASKVIDRKVSRGKTFVVLRDALNGFARPALERLVCRYSPDASPPPSEPLFTGRGAFEILTLKEPDAPRETATLVGGLCTATDVVAEDATLPRLEPGDLAILTNAGSYAATLSPFRFSSRERPTEFYLTSDGEILAD